jgi:glycerol-3-phosphate acyltransferase PlsX
VRHTDKAISSDEKAAQALRRGKGSSLWNCIEAVRDGDARAAVSGGNTGGLMAISKLLLRMAGDLDRPAIVASWPTLRGTTAVLDVGANVTSDAAQLVEFAIMGEAFHRAIHGTKQPTIGLLNVGSEEQKGHEEVREAHKLLREAGLDLDYRGFVEGDDIAKGTVDVVVTDGFSGNIALKSLEGTARFVTDLLRRAFTSSLRSKIGFLISRPATELLRHHLDPNNHNGAVFLGLNGLVVKSHGGASEKGVANAIRVAARMVREDITRKIADDLAHVTAQSDRLVAAK